MVPAYKLINKLANSQRRIFEALSLSEGVSAAQGRVLHFILNSGLETIIQKDIEEEFGIQPPSATALLKSMEQNGLIRREASASDGRYKHIIVTEKGLSYKDKINEEMADLEKRITGDISDEELAIWEKVSRQFLENLKNNRKKD